MGEIDSLDAYLAQMVKYLHLAHIRREMRDPLGELSAVDYESAELSLSSAPASILFSVYGQLIFICEYVFGFHQFRHSLSTFLTTKKKVDPKTAQTALRQSSVEFTLNKYTQTDNDELLATQNLMLDAIFNAPPPAVQ